MSAQPGTSILWQRLDVPGHDAAVLVERAHGAEVHGMAVFRDEDDTTAALHYRVHCDVGWQTTEAYIHGWHSGQPIEFRIERDSAGRWSFNGAMCPAVTGCLDLDLSFTPATNLLPLRRLGLAIGHRAEVRSAWLEWPAGSLTPLVQRYVRQSATIYRYEADLPGHDSFARVLHVDPLGWVLDYDGLWRAEATASAR